MVYLQSLPQPATMALVLADIKSMMWRTDTLKTGRRWGGNRCSRTSSPSPCEGRLGVQGSGGETHGHLTLRRTFLVAHTGDTRRSGTGGGVGRPVASTAQDLGTRRILWVFGLLWLCLLYLNTRAHCSTPISFHCL